MIVKCRLCLNPIEDQSSITNIDDIGFRDKLDIVFTFPIKLTEALPSFVCSQCEEKVEQICTYHEQVKRNQELLSTVQKQECFEEVKVEPSHDVDFNAFEIPFEETEPLDEVAIKHDAKCEKGEDGGGAACSNPTDSELARNCSSSDSSNETENKNVDDNHKLNRSQSSRNKKNVVYLKSPNSVLSKANVDKKTKRKKFNPTDETNRRLQEFYDMKCEICAKQHDSFTTLKMHYHQQHHVQGYIKCCGRKFSSRYRLLEHLSYHVGASMVRCEICNKNFSSRSYLQVHNSRLHGKAEDRPFKCTQCHQSYAMECHLKAHMVSHVRVNCSICGKELSSSLSLRTHMINMHGKRENHICDSCGKEFRTRQAFDRHVNLHMGIEVTEQVQCGLCSKWLNTKRALKVHIKYVHTEAGQTFKCDLCTHECPNSRALANHKLRVHVEERFECEVCGKRFKRQLYLKEHLALHTGKPLYSCDICGATFNSNANKYSHRKNKHPIEWEARRRQQQQQTEGE